MKESEGLITTCPPHDFKWTSDGRGNFSRCMKCSVEQYPGVRLVSVPEGE